MGSKGEVVCCSLALRMTPEANGYKLPAPVYKLLHMPPLMLQVVLNQPAQRHRRIVPDFALRLKPIFGDPIHHCFQDLVLRLPPRQ